MRTSAVESFDELNKIVLANRIRDDAFRNRKCFRHLEIDSAECWCRGAGPTGGDLPCPTKT
jgi:hypothetical protein